MKHASDNIVHMFPSNCSPASNSSASVITASNSKWTKCHSSGYINSTPFGDNSFKSCLSVYLFMWTLSWLIITLACFMSCPLSVHLDLYHSLHFWIPVWSGWVLRSSITECHRPGIFLAWGVNHSIAFSHELGGFLLYCLMIGVFMHLTISKSYFLCGT